MTGNDTAGSWWNWRVLGLWVLLNAAAFLVVVVGGARLLVLLSSGRTQDLADENRALAVLVIALIGAAIQGFVIGRWQWRILRLRVSGLPRRQWVMATFVPAVLVWLLAIAPGAVDTLAQHGDTFSAFKNDFIQALVLGPLIGLSQATALRGYTARWKWWFVANITTWLFGAISYEFGKWLLNELSVSANITPAFPILAFVVHGVWMLWVTAPDATAHMPARASGAETDHAAALTTKTDGGHGAIA
jgi:Na+/citrate or Na+/malate symporter